MKHAKSKIITITCSSCQNETILYPVTFRKYRYNSRSYKLLDGYMCQKCGHLINKLIGV